MHIVTLEWITIFLYGCSTGFQGAGLKRKNRLAQIGLFGFGVPALMLHAYLLYQWIDLDLASQMMTVDLGQNLYFFNILSLLAWLTSFLISLIALKKPIQSLALFVFPLAALSIILVMLFPGQVMIDTAASPKELIHILLSLFTFSVLFIAGGLAVLLIVQDALLRAKHFSLVTQCLPAIETVETLLFGAIALGFLLLSLVLLSSFFLFKNTLSTGLLGYIYFSMMAWLVFAILLWGRHYLGWRGRVAIRWTLGGVALLAFSYLTHWIA